MRIQPTQPNKPSFGILKKHKLTSYGQYMAGEYKNYNIEIYDAKRDKMKLQYVSNKVTLKWIKSKLKYIQDGITKVIKSNS